jgi:hypothetical protein
MAAKLTMTAAKTSNGIAYARVGVYDVEKDYKDSFSVDKYVTMFEDEGSTVIISSEWTSKEIVDKGKETERKVDVEHGKKTLKLDGSTITINDGGEIRIYDGIKEAQLKTFYEVSKAVKNGSDNFNSISMKNTKQLEPA